MALKKCVINVFFKPFFIYMSVYLVLSTHFLVHIYSQVDNSSDSITWPLTIFLSTTFFSPLIRTLAQFCSYSQTSF